MKIRNKTNAISFPFSDQLFSAPSKPQSFYIIISITVASRCPTRGPLYEANIMKRMFLPQRSYSLDKTRDNRRIPQTDEGSTWYQ